MTEAEKQHLLKREAEQRDAIAVVRETIDAIEQQRRNPEQWERVYIVHAPGGHLYGGLQPREDRGWSRSNS